MNYITLLTSAKSYRASIIDESSEIKRLESMQDELSKRSQMSEFFSRLFEGSLFCSMMFASMLVFGTILYFNQSQYGLIENGLYFMPFESHQSDAKLVATIVLSVLIPSIIITIVSRIMYVRTNKMISDLNENISKFEDNGHLNVSNVHRNLESFIKLHETISDITSISTIEYRTALGVLDKVLNRWSMMSGSISLNNLTFDKLIELFDRDAAFVTDLTFTIDDRLLKANYNIGDESFEDSDYIPYEIF